MMADGQTRSPERRGGRAVRWWLAAATFVLGVVVGAVAVGLVSEDAVTLPGAGAAPTNSAAATGAAGRTSSPGDDDAVAVLANDACLRALNAAQDIYGSVDDLARAASELDVSRLDEAIRRLQPLQQRLQSDLADCEVVTRLPNGSAVTSKPPVSTGAAPTS